MATPATAPMWAQDAYLRPAECSLGQLLLQDDAFRPFIAFGGGSLSVSGDNWWSLVSGHKNPVAGGWVEIAEGRR
jgi:hypothetical protein